MLEFFRKPKSIHSESMMDPHPERAREFVAEGKKQAPKRGPDGRVTYGDTPVMSKEEAAVFGRINRDELDQNLAQPRFRDNSDDAHSRIAARVTRAGYFDLDEQVEGVKPSIENQVVRVGGSVDVASLTKEEMLERHDVLLKDIADLTVRQMALDDKIDHESLQELSRVNRTLQEKRGALEHLEQAMTSSADGQLN